jgi:hypothetical protein
MLLNITPKTRINKFNDLLEKECSYNNIIFINFNQYILNKNLHVNKLFTLKHSLINIHLFFEHILIVILLKTPLKSVLNYVDINSLKNTMQASINKWKKFTSV